MSTSLELYYYPECPYCQKVLRALDGLGAADAIVLKNIHADDDARQTLIAVGGEAAGSLPVHRRCAPVRKRRHRQVASRAVCLILVDAPNRVIP